MTCHLVVKCIPKEISSLCDQGTCLKTKTDNFIVHLHPKRMKELKITTKNNLVVITSQNSKMVVCQVERSYNGDWDYSCVNLNKLVRYNLSVVEGDVVYVQACKNCHPAPFLEIGVLPHESISKMTVDFLRDTVIRHFTQNPCGICKKNKFTVHGYGEQPLTFVVNDISAKSYCLTNPHMSILISKKLAQYEPGEKSLSEITYDDVGGYKQQLSQLRKIEFSLKFPSFYKFRTEQPLPKIIFSGCSGVGKSLIVQALSNETNKPLILVNGDEFSNEFHQSITHGKTYLEKKCSEAKQKSPSILCLDKLEQIASTEEGDVNSQLVEVFSKFLEEEPDVVLIGISNDTTLVNPSLIDLFWNPFMDFNIQFEKPNLIERRSILLNHLKNMPLAKDFDLMKVVMEDLEDFTGAEIASLCKKVYQNNNSNPNSPAIEPCTNDDFKKALLTF